MKISHVSTISVAIDVMWGCKFHTIDAHLIMCMLFTLWWAAKKYMLSARLLYLFNLLQVIRKTCLHIQNTILMCRPHICLTKAAVSYTIALSDCIAIRHSGSAACRAPRRACHTDHQQLAWHCICFDLGADLGVLELKKYRCWYYTAASNYQYWAQLHVIHRSYVCDRAYYFEKLHACVLPVVFSTYLRMWLLFPFADTCLFVCFAGLLLPAACHSTLDGSSHECHSRHHRLSSLSVFLVYALCCLEKALIANLHDVHA